MLYQYVVFKTLMKRKKKVFCDVITSVLYGEDSIFQLMGGGEDFATKVKTAFK